MRNQHAPVQHDHRLYNDWVEALKAGSSLGRIADLRREWERYAFSDDGFYAEPF